MRPSDSAPASMVPSPATAPPALSGRVLALAVVLCAMPFPIVVRDLSQNSFDSYDYVTILFPVDLALMALLLVAGRSMLADLRHRSVDIGWAGWAAVAVLMTLALAAHPSGRGLHNVLELYGASAVAYTLARARRGTERTAILATVGAVAVLETSWAIAQRINRAPLGLFRLGESRDPFYRSFGALAPQGSMVHIYVLAGLALTAGALLAWGAIEAERPLPWLFGAGVATMPIGYTYSRAGALSLMLLVGVVAFAGGRSRWRRSAFVATALTLGALAPALVWSAGWTARVRQTTGASSANSLTTDRGKLVDQADKLIRSEPLTGVGPGQYVIALHGRLARPDDRKALFKPVHDVPLLLAAEGGALTGALVIGLLAALAWRCLRTGALSIAVYLSYLPFFLLDHFAYTFPQGMVLTGLWLGALDAISRPRATPA